MTKSPLATIVNISPNSNNPRTAKIDRITPHCFVGQVSAARGLEVFLPSSKQASTNYVVGYDGSCGCGVYEENRSWCSSSGANDHRAITIEVASETADPYKITEAAEAKLLDLMTDICKRYGKTKLVWISDKDKALAYKPADNEMQLTVHRWFANKSCPGDYMYNRFSYYAEEVTKRLSGNAKQTLYCVQMGAFSVKSNAEKLAAELKAKGYDTYITTKEV